MLQSRTVLQDFRIIRPKYELDQAELLNWLGNAHAQVEAWNCPISPRTAEGFVRLFRRFGCSPKRIGKRGTELSDCTEKSIARMEVYGPSDLTTLQTGAVRGISGVGVSTRVQFFDRITKTRVQQFFENDTMAPQHLVHVTCTGYSSPSSVQTLVSKRGWTEQSSITHAYHMGCYASLPAVRIANGLRAAGLGRIDIVHTELCSLHLNLADHSPEQMVVQSLFADGYIRYSAVNSENSGPSGLELITIHEEILPDSTDLMTWQTSEWGMRMTLSKDVPKQITASIHEFIIRMLKRMMKPAQSENSRFLSEAIFAIHPGGPKIIDQLQAQLQLREDQVMHSKAILFNYGNMSSATLPHIWSSILEDDTIRSGSWVLSLAFGPGLTAFGAIMRKR